MPKDRLSGSMVLKDKQERVGVVVEPNLNSDVLEKVSIAGEKFDLSISELDFLMVRTVDQRIKLGSIF
jgi:hypothetical protein